MRHFLRTYAPILALLFLVSAAVQLGAADAAPAATAAPAHKSNLSLLDLVILAGPIEYLLILLSIISYSLGIQWIFTIKRENLIPEGLADELHNIMADGPTDEAVENARTLVSNDRSMLGNIIAAALDKKDYGYETMKEAAEVVGASETNKYMGKVGWMSMFASSATLIGLLGTVSGIIGSFLTMSSAPGGADPSQLAGDIGEALVCTGTGLFIAIGNLYIFFFLRGRVNTCTLDSAIITNEILDYFRSR
jgi:biopolymer transport protein ExbB